MRILFSLLLLTISLSSYSADEFITLTGTWKGTMKTLDSTKEKPVTLTIIQDIAYVTGFAKIDSFVPQFTFKGTLLYDYEVQKNGPFSFNLYNFDHHKTIALWRVKFTQTLEKKKLTIKWYMVDGNGQPLTEFSTALIEAYKE